MRKLDNIVIKNEDTGDNLFLDNNKKNDPACTLNLIKLVLNNPLDGMREDGTGQPHHYTVEEMDTALKIMDKVKGAIKSGHGMADSVKSFELEDAEVDFVAKFVKNYKPLYTGLAWAKFIKQF